MRGLKIFLWIAGIVCLTSVIGMFLPMPTWNSFAKVFGVESLPDSPFVVYMIRLMCATYAGIGIFFIILALDPTRYGPMVPFAGVAAVILGIVCMITGIMVAMPAKWFLGDSLSCLVLGILVLAFWQAAKKTPTNST